MSYHSAILSTGRRRRLEALRAELLALAESECAYGRYADPIARVDALLTGKHTPPPMYQQLEELLAQLTLTLAMLPKGEQMNLLRGGLTQCKRATEATLEIPSAPSRRERQTV